MIEFELGRTVTTHDVKTVDICENDVQEVTTSPPPLHGNHISIKFFLNHKDIGYLRIKRNSNIHLGKLSSIKDQNKNKVVNVLQSMQSATKEYSFFVKMLQIKKNHLQGAFKDMATKLGGMRKNFGVEHDREFVRLDLDLNEIIEDEADSLIYTFHKIQKFKVTET